jgi:signal recognition particle subunit SEC65
MRSLAGCSAMPMPLPQGPKSTKTEGTDDTPGLTESTCQNSRRPGRCVSASPCLCCQKLHRAVLDEAVRELPTSLILPERAQHPREADVHVPGLLRSKGGARHDHLMGQLAGPACRCPT